MLRVLLNLDAHLYLCEGSIDQHDATSTCRVPEDRFIRGYIQSQGYNSEKHQLNKMIWIPVKTNTFVVFLAWTRYGTKLHLGN